MKLYDVTLTMKPGMPVWPGDIPVELERMSKIEEGANSNVSRLQISVHTGTHVDAPRHFLPEGKTIETLDLDALVGPALVFEIPEDQDLITADLLISLKYPEKVTRVLFKTKNSKIWALGTQDFEPRYTSISTDGAELLVKRGAKLVGIDYLSVAPYKRTRPTHEILLKASVVALEGLDLTEVNPGIYQVYCLPLKLYQCDGAPARVILVEQ
jgi:arylformamidase